MLDSDLAAIYGVSTKRLNEQVKRNLERFPADFMFQLTAKEGAALRSQIATGSLQATDSQRNTSNQSQIATGSQRHRDPRLRPYAFTEYGALMAANVLNNPQAVQMNTTCGDAVGWTALVAWRCDRASRGSASQRVCHPRLRQNARDATWHARASEETSLAGEKAHRPARLARSSDRSRPSRVGRNWGQIFRACCPNRSELKIIVHKF
jgi:hypothetical protein